MNPFRAVAALHRSTPQVTFPAHAEQEKTGPELRCTLPLIRGRRRIRIQKRDGQATDFKETDCCPSAVVQRAAEQKTE